MRATLVKLVGVSAAGIAGAALLGATSYAAPSHSPNLTTGTGTCSNGVTYSFVAQGNNGQGQSWSPAFLTATDGSRALFIPASFDFTLTAPDGSMFPQGVVMKPTAPGPVSCEITGNPVSFPGATLSGTTTGTIVTLGRH